MLSDITVASFCLSKWSLIMREDLDKVSEAASHFFSHTTHIHVTVRHVKYNRRSWRIGKMMGTMAKVSMRYHAHTSQTNEKKKIGGR